MDTRMRMRHKYLIYSLRVYYNDQEERGMSRKKPAVWLILPIVLLLATLACGQFQVGMVTPTLPEEKATPAKEAVGVAAQDEVQLVVTTIVTPQPPTGEPPVSETKPVIAWRGSIHGLPQASRYDDFVILQPGGTGELGLQGATAELESEIRSLRDADPPNDSVLIWGELVCEVDDYNGCQIVVDRLQYGPVHTEGEPVEGWEGTITSSTFNSGISYIFELAGDYPMWYSLYASQDPALQELIESLRDTGAVIQVWGKLLTGVPDVNGTRIEASVLGVLEEGRQIPDPLPENVIDPAEGWQTFVNDRYNYQINYPPEAELSFSGPQGFPGDELPDGVTAEEYIESQQKLYTDKLCVSIHYGLGYIYISAPENEGFKYTTCGRTGVGQAEIVEKTETMQIDDLIYQVKGMEIIGEDDILDFHNETYFVILEDGTRIEFGAVPHGFATYEDYLMKTRDTLLEMVESYQSLD